MTLTMEEEDAEANSTSTTAVQETSGGKLHVVRVGQVVSAELAALKVLSSV